MNRSRGTVPVLPPDRSCHHPAHDRAARREGERDDRSDHRNGTGGNDAVFRRRLRSAEEADEPHRQRLRVGTRQEPREEILVPRPRW